MHTKPDSSCLEFFAMAADDYLSVNGNCQDCERSSLVSRSRARPTGKQGSQSPERWSQGQWGRVVPRKLHQAQANQWSPRNILILGEERRAKMVLFCQAKCSGLSSTSEVFSHFGQCFPRTGFQGLTSDMTAHNRLCLAKHGNLHAGK